MNDLKQSGDVLKSSRERLGLSINDVAVATKINPRILKALEDGQKEHLPPKSFARGFIRSYAAYLKIDAQPILDAYTHDEGAAAKSAAEAAAAKLAAPTKAAPAAYNSVANKTSAAPRTLRTSQSSVVSKAVLVGSILVLLVLVVGIKKIVDKYAQERVIETPLPIVEVSNSTPTTEAIPESTPPPAAVAPEEPKPEVAVPSTTAAEVEANLKAKAEQLAKAEADKLAKTEADKLALAAKLAADAAAAKAAVDKQLATEKLAKAEADKLAKTEAEKQALAAKLAAEKPAKAVLKGPPQEVILEALDKVDVTIRVDGEEPKKITLAPESLHTIKAKSEIQIEVSDGGTVNVIHNGRERGVAGDLGKPTKLKYP